MSNYLIIDSNKEYARKLYGVLSGEELREEGSEDKNYWNCSELLLSELGKLSDDVKNKLNGDKTKIILINAEAKLKSGYIQDLELIEVAFWLRCKHKLENPIVFYSLQSINNILKTKPENFILHSPGCYHLRLPATREQIIKIASLKPLEKFNSIKPFLKPKIKLELTRHRFANYTGMALMLLIASNIWGRNKDEQNLTNNKLSSTEFWSFTKSLDYFLITFYYDLKYTEIARELSEAKDSLKVANPKRVLLVDDLADNGWKAILSKVIYGNFEDKDNRIEALQISTTKEGFFDFDKTKADLENRIKMHKPYILLLDLRLNDEEGKKDITELGGYKLLEFIKSSSTFKGLPVIMFTASSKTDTIKKLLDAGAEYVWSKPGIDEELNAPEIVDRYVKLVEKVGGVFDKFSNLSYQSATAQFSEFRIRLLEKLEWVKYRLSLYEETELSVLLQSTDFKKFTDIYIDTNFFMKNSFNVNIVESICNLYIVSRLTSQKSKVYVVNGNNTPLVEPAVVVLNEIWDELIKHTKMENDPIYGLMSSLIKDFYKEGIIRTQYHTRSQPPDWKPTYKLWNPKENLYADPFIIDDISHLAALKYQTFAYKNYVTGSEIKQKVVFPNRNVLLVCADKDLLEKTKRMFRGAGFEQYSILEFNEESEKFQL